MSISQLLRKYKDTGVYIGPTLGLSSPKNDRRACLCLDKNTYSRSCCDGLLIQQGIGNITSSRIQPAVALGGFSTGFSSGFQITS
jgi:hypothetical protein